ncbi:MAG TPA: o-succinylbenzoate synthase [Actinomycetes bacterium]|nr:o-succinylbenzoate synthase [Actinomycetes bacterium]
MLPDLAEILANAQVFSLPLRLPFRGVTHREGMLIQGPAGWGEFAPFVEYGPSESSRWLAAAIEAAWQGWPQGVRDEIAVNAIVPEVSPETAERLVAESGCSSVKVKVAASRSSFDSDVARVAAVRNAVGAAGQVRIDANGAWSVDDAVGALKTLNRYDLEYVEQPCRTVAECAEVRRLTDVRVAVDEGIRKADHPEQVVGLKAAADIVIVKVAPLGGVNVALALVEKYELPAVVSSALDTSVGLAAGAALAAALPSLPFACGLGSGLLLAADVTTNPMVPAGGRIRPRSVAPDDQTLEAVAASPEQVARWRSHLADSYQALEERAVAHRGGTR